MAVTIARASAKELEDAIPALAAMLREAVALGAGLGYSAPPSEAEAERAWRTWVADPMRAILLARDGNEVVGTVQLDLARVQNASHRAELAKLIVRADRRGQGIGARLISACLDEARALGRTTVWLCTIEPEAERLYARCGFTKSGEIPNWSIVAGQRRIARFWYVDLA